MLRREIAEARFQSLGREIETRGFNALMLVSRAQPRRRGAIRFVSDFTS